MIKETFKTYEEALQFIKSYENEHGYKFIFRAVASGFTNKLTSLFHRKVLFGRDDLPIFMCQMGNHYFYVDLEDNRTTRVTTGVPVVPRKKNYMKKLIRESEPCPAEIQIMSLVYFPEYKITSEMNKAEMSKMTDHLRKHFNAETCIPHYIVEIDENHSNHTKPLEVIDQQAVQFIQDLVERGYYSPASITEQLEILYETWPVKPDKKDPKFYPGHERIRRQIFPLINKQRNIEREKGFTHDLDEALQRIRDFEKDTCTQYQCRDLDSGFGQHDVYIASRTNPVLTSTYSERRCRIDTGGVPYIIMGTRSYECSHGIDYKHKFIEPYTPAQRKNMDRKGNVMCTARCTLKEVALFPAYRIDSSVTSKQVREAILEKLQEDLKNCRASYERVIAYAFPCVDEHCGHVYREANGVLFLDSRIKAQICELVSEGVRSVAEMRRHLKMYLKHQFDELAMPGPFNKKYRPSAQTIVNLMCEQGVLLEDIIQDVKDPVYYFSKSSDQHETGKEQMKEVEQGAVVHMSNTENSQTPYDELVRSLEILQSEHSNKQKKTAASKEIETSPSEAAVPNPEEAKQKGEDTFLDVVFRKQSECQSLLEEILQIVYQLSDVYRLRDLRELLVRVKDCLKDGKLLCDEVSIGGNSKHEQILQKKDKTDANDGVSETLKESPTEIVIRESNEQITAVEIPDNSTEIVIYHTHDDLGEQIIVVKETSDVNEGNYPIQGDANGMNVPANKDSPIEGIKKDFIKVRCKEFFSKEDVLKMLNISENRIGKPNSSGGSSGQHSKGDLHDLQTEIKNQEKELLQMEKDKASLSMMEMRVSKNDQTSRNRNSTEKQLIHAKTKRKHQTDFENSTGMPRVKRVYASNLKDQDIMDAQDMDMSDNDVSHSESHSKTTAIKDTTCQTTELTANEGTKVKPPGVSNSTSKQILPNKLIAVNNIVYSSTPVGLIPARTTANRPLIIPNKSPNKRKINLIKSTSTTEEKQMQAESSNLSSSPSSLNKTSENQIVNKPTIKQTFEIPNKPASLRNKQINISKNDQVRLTHENKQAQTICSTKQTPLTLDANLEGPQNQINSTECERVTSKGMETDNVTTTEIPCSSETTKTTPVYKVSNSPGVHLQHVQRLLHSGTKIKPGNIRVIKVKRNSSTDVNNQFTVADVRVNLSDTQKTGQTTTTAVSPTVTPVQSTSSDSPAIIESSSVLNEDAKMRHSSVENTKAAIETAAKDSPSRRSMKTRGRIVRFSKSGEIL